MKPVDNDTIVRQLHWRYATKKFDPSRKIAPEDWQTLEQALICAPSSYGLQPWKFFVVTDPAVRAKLHPVSWNQAQILDASHLVVFAVKKNLGPADVDRYLTRIAEVRGVSLESLDAFKGMMLGSLKKPVEEVNAWCTRQVYIALGFFLSAAAMLGIDACPMEGFQPDKYDEILGLTKLGYGATVLGAAGYRAENDQAVKLPKVRFKVEDVVANLKG
jgi:nitroreductase